MSRKKTVVVGLLGTTLDVGKGPNRWDRWRPTVALCQHEDLLVDRLELLFQRRFTALANTVTEDSPGGASTAARNRTDRPRARHGPR